MNNRYADLVSGRARLPKWSRLLVLGENVTPAQADEILIRTCAPRHVLWHSDPEWKALLMREMGLPDEPDWTPGEEPGWYDQYEQAIRRAMDALGILDLEYLYTHRITRLYLTGHGGWCDWDGTIREGTYSVGKRPSVPGIRDEWQMIASAFPFLRLTAQLLDGDGSFGAPLVQFEVAGGVARVQPPGGRLPVAPDDTDAFTDRHEVERLLHSGAARLLDDGRVLFPDGRVHARYPERGVDPDRLRRAVRYVRQKTGHSPQG